MRTSVRLCGVAVVSAASLTMVAAPAFADSAANNGVNLLDDDNVSVLPVQVCNTGEVVPVLSHVVDLLGHSQSQSPNTNDCVNAPIVDHPTAG